MMIKQFRHGIKLTDLDLNLSSSYIGIDLSSENPDLTAYMVVSADTCKEANEIRDFVVHALNDWISNRFETQRGEK